jgi:hypothetical protein
MRVSIVLLTTTLAVAPLGCKREATHGSSKAAAATRVKPATASKPLSSGAVSRIVFVDKEKACACTRERIDKSWKALTDVVGYPPIPDVERIHMDSQAAKAEPYKKQRAIMVPPAIYFLDKQGKLVEVLQGEVKSGQVKKVLGTT